MSAGAEQTRLGGGGAEPRSAEAASAEVHFGDSHGEWMVQANREIPVWIGVVGVRGRIEL